MTNILELAKAVAAQGLDVTYPSRASAQHVRGVVRGLIELIENNQTTNHVILEKSEPGRDWTPVGTKGVPIGIWLDTKTDVSGLVGFNYFKAMAHMPLLGPVAWIGKDGKAIDPPTHWRYLKEQK